MQGAIQERRGLSMGMSTYSEWWLVLSSLEKGRKRQKYEPTKEEFNLSPPQGPKDPVYVADC